MDPWKTVHEQFSSLTSQRAGWGGHTQVPSSLKLGNSECNRPQSCLSTAHPCEDKDCFLHEDNSLQGFPVEKDQPASGAAALPMSNATSPSMDSGSDVVIFEGKPRSEYPEPFKYTARDVTTLLPGFCQRLSQRYGKKSPETSSIEWSALTYGSDPAEFPTYAAQNHAKQKTALQDNKSACNFILRGPDSSSRVRPPKDIVPEMLSPDVTEVGFPLSHARHSETPSTVSAVHTATETPERCPKFLPGFTKRHTYALGLPKVPQTPRVFDDDTDSEALDHMDPWDLVYDSSRLYCGLGGCEANYLDPQDLKEHRYYEHGDCYCPACDLGFNDFEQLTAHKIQSDRHISCCECGEDFKTEYSRDRHLEREHPEPKDIDCPGCRTKFKNPGSMIAHIENGKCRQISATTFLKFRVYGTLYATRPDNPQQSSEEMKAAAIEASFGSIETLNILGTKRYRGAPPVPKTDLAEFPNKSAKSKSILRMQTVPSGYKDALVLPEGFKEPPSSVHAAQYLAVGQDEEVRRAVRFMWGGSPLIRAPDVFDTGCNTRRGFNPFLPEFDAQLFFCPIRKTFKCPVHSCQRQFGLSNELGNHMREKVHVLWVTRCPNCHKEFNQVARLIAHFESGGLRCEIHRRHWFPHMMEIASSGMVAYTKHCKSGPVFRSQAPRLPTP